MTTSAIVHDDQLYLADGDFALFSGLPLESTITAFRVHKSVMAFHSPVFRDMVGLHATSAARVTYEGAPVVQVAASAADLRALLTVLYVPGALGVARWNPDAPHILTPVMRLARRYEMDAVCRRVVETFKVNWPQTFDEWLHFYGEYAALAALCAAPTPAPGVTAPLWARVPEPGAAVQFAHEFDVPEILPFAYYTLAGISTDMEWGKYTSNRLSAAQRLARWDLLAPEDLMRVLRVREQLASDPMTIRELHESFEEDVYTCCCFEYSSRLRTALEDAYEGPAVEGSLRCYDPLGALERVYIASQQWSLCDICIKQIKETIRSWQTECWEALHKLS